MHNRQDDLSLQEVINGFKYHFNTVIAITAAGLAIGILMAVIQFAYFSFNKQYTASTSMVVTPKPNSESLSGFALPTSSEITLSGLIIASAEYITKSEKIYYKVIETLDIPITYEEFKQAVHISRYESTNIIMLDVTLSDEKTAILLVNAITDVLPEVLMETLTMGSVNVIDRPLEAVESRNSYGPMFAIVGLMVGAFAAVVWSVFYTISHPTIMSTEMLRTQINVEPMAEIYHQDARRLHEYLKGNQANVSVSYLEYFSTLTAVFKRVATSTQAKCIMLSSSLEGEGKSTIAINLAQSLAVAGHRVLLIDADTRKPVVGKAFDLTELKARSLNEVSKGNTEFKKAIIVLPSKLNVIQCFSTKDRLINKTIIDNILEFKKIFDYVIIDTAPVGVVSDAYSLSECVDGAVIVVRQAFATSDFVATVCENTEKSGIPVIGAVLNDVRENRTQMAYYRRYYRRSYYPYYSNYSRYHSSSEQAEFGEMAEPPAEQDTSSKV